MMSHVTLGHNQDLFHLLDLGHNFFIPEDQCSGNSGLQAVTGGWLDRSKVYVSVVLTDAAVEKMIRFYWRQWDTIRLPPERYRLLTMLCSSLCFIVLATGSHIWSVTPELTRWSRLLFSASE